MGQQKIENFNHGEIQEQYTLAPLRELDLENESELSSYFEMLTHPDNIKHFSSPPENPADLKLKLVRDRTHAYLAENMLGEIVGAGGINDAPEGEHDHFLVKIVVHPDYKGKGVGRQLVTALTDIAFSTPAVTITATGERKERERIKLDAATIRYVEGWDIMPRLLSSLGYRFVHFLPNQVTVKDRNTGEEVLRPTERYEISREDWQIRQSSKNQVNNQ